jgi:hypothetical protein
MQICRSKKFNDLLCLVKPLLSMEDRADRATSNLSTQRFGSATFTSATRMLAESVPCASDGP